MEREKISGLVNILRPVYLTSLKLQTEHLWLDLKLIVESPKNANSVILFRCLQQGEAKMINNKTTLAVIYLDPRIRRILVNEPFKMLGAKTPIKQLAQQLHNSRNTVFTTATRNDNEPFISSQATSSVSTQAELTNQSTCSLFEQYFDPTEVSQKQRHQRERFLKSVTIIQSQLTQISP